MMKNRIWSVLFSLFILIGYVDAKISISPVLGSGMVLQRQTEVKLWGTAEAHKTLKITTTWNNAATTTVADETGKWIAKVKTSDAGGPYTIKIESGREKILLDNILLGEVWLCSGQSNMEMPVIGFPYQPVIGSGDALLNADNPKIRLFTVKKAPVPTPQDTCSGKWETANAETVSKFSAVGYFYARILQQKLGVPVGMICSSVGGTRIEAWMSSNTLRQFPGPLQLSAKEQREQNRPSHLYNGMIHPLLNCSFRGAIWYQGESNKDNYQDYGSLLNALVADWRSGFSNGQFPFYYVQIAPYMYNKSSDALTAYLREQQLKAQALIPNAGMVCTLDLGNEFWIHPAEKQKVAERLCLRALSETYGYKGLIYQSPVFKNFEVKDSLVTLYFDHAESGITTFDKRVDCFEVAGADKVFYPATLTKLTNNLRKIQIVCPMVKKPVAVRYAFSNFPQTEGYLFGITGLPVPSFRTDNW